MHGGRHEYNIARADDPDFPTNFDERHQRLHLQRGFDQIHSAVARFTARANLPVREAGREALSDFVREIAATTIRLCRSSPTFDANSIPAIRPTTLTRRIRELGADVFERMVMDFSSRIHYANLVTDAGTVLGFNAFHALLSNPNYPDVSLPLDTYENLNFNSENYEQVFRELISQCERSQIDVVSIICDNCPAQVNGVTQALAFYPHLGILHIPCLNHMVNLVFTHAVETHLVASRINLLTEFIQDLRSPIGMDILHRKCPSLVRTRWIYAVDVLRFILERRELVSTVRNLTGHDPIPDNFVTLYWILLPLKLFSLSMETRSRKLSEVLPIAQETLREFQMVRERIEHEEDIEILEFVTLHFLARLRTNAFEDIVTAWVLSQPGRDSLRVQEARFLTRFRPPEIGTCRGIECIEEQQARFLGEFEPWVKDNPDDPPGHVDISSATMEELPVMHVRDGDGFAPLLMEQDLAESRSTRVAQQRADFDQELTRQRALNLADRLNQSLEMGAFCMAIKRVKHMAEALGIDQNELEIRLREWLFTQSVPDIQGCPDQHWREVHAQSPAWRNLARIGVRYATIGTSEAEVERLIGEQQEIQGQHGVNFGTDTLHARLVVRHAPTG
jgi:hypothetical protein